MLSRYKRNKRYRDLTIDEKIEKFMKESEQIQKEINKRRWRWRCV